MSPGNIHPFLHPMSSSPPELCPFYLEPCGQPLAVSKMFPDPTKEGLPTVSSAPTDEVENLPMSGQISWFTILSRTPSCSLHSSSIPAKVTSRETSYLFTRCVTYLSSFSALPSPSCSLLAEPSHSHQVSRKQGKGTSVFSLQVFGTYLVSDLEPLSKFPLGLSLVSCLAPKPVT